MGPDAASWCARECIAGVDVAGCGTPFNEIKVAKFNGEYENDIVVYIDLSPVLF